MKPTGSTVDFDDVVLLGVIVLISIFASWTLSGCASSANAWTEKDTANATDLARASLALEAICDREAGVCLGAPVRSIESAEFCAATSMLFRHNAPIPDGGAVRCSP